MTPAPSIQQTPVAILLGGKGTRLGLKDRPKPMVDFMGAPLLERAVRQLVAQGFTDLVFLTGHMGDVIERHFENGARFGAQIHYVHEDIPLGTARATRAAADHLGSGFVLLYGDVAFDIDLVKFVSQAKAWGGDGTLFVHPNDHPFDSDLVASDSDTHRIHAFLNKPHSAALQARNLVNAGLYYLTPNVFDHIPEGDALFDWGRDVFPNAIRNGAELYAYRSAEYIKDVGTPDRIVKAEKAVSSGLVQARSMRHRQRAVFLDRDGVINKEIDGVHRPEQFELLPQLAQTIAEINRSHFLSIGITNQPDIAKGFFTFEDLELVLCEMDAQLSEGGAYLDDLYYCPHHPEAGHEGEVPELKRPCTCRKPAPGMLVKAAEDYNIDLTRSYMIGDRISDLQAGRAAGCRTIFVHRNAGQGIEHDTPDALLALADHVAKDVSEAWALIKKDDAP